MINKSAVTFRLISFASSNSGSAINLNLANYIQLLKGKRGSEAMSFAMTQEANLLVAWLEVIRLDTTFIIPFTPTNQSQIHTLNPRFLSRYTIHSWLSVCEPAKKL